MKHSSVDKDGDLYPVISIDYVFFRTEEDVKTKDIGSSKLPIEIAKRFGHTPSQKRAPTILTHTSVWCEICKKLDIKELY